MTKHEDTTVAGSRDRLIAAYSSMSTALLTLLTFALACYAVPIAGPYCPEEIDCITYPYVHGIADRFPRDYAWMMVAIPQLMAYLVMTISVQAIASPEKRVYGTIALVFATAATTILVSNYFVQLSVIQPSILAGETDNGLALLTMYNDKGVFIALEEVGYLFMSASFLALAPIVRSSMVRWTLVSSFVSTILSLLYYILVYEWERSYRFEVAVICIDWMTLVVFGLVTARALWTTDINNEKVD